MKLFLIIALFFNFSLFAQNMEKNARVAEMEDKLKESAMEHIKARFPSVPFMVSVKIDPLRRNIEKNSSGSSNEELPYFETESEEEMLDEWDNPEIPLNALLNRSRKIQVQISVPANISEIEANELKEGVFNILHLVPIRDEIVINRRNWAMEEVPWIKIYIVLGLIILALIGILFINRGAANKIARALSEIRQSTGSSPVMSSTSLLENSEESHSPTKQSISQELRLNDSFKLKEMSTFIIQNLMKNEMFPNHHDIFALDKFGKNNSEKLGSILVEFPLDIQKKIFSYAKGIHWVEAFNNPGQLDFESFTMLQSLEKILRDPDYAYFSKAVLAVWRLTDRVHFFKGIPKDQAFAILNEFPKSMAIADARLAFPGSWAVVIDPNFSPIKVSGADANQIFASALMTEPLANFDMIKQYKSEREILDYLKFVDPVEEKDIYGATPANSMIHMYRPPFYQIFSESDAVLEMLASKISLENWSLALFNLPKLDRMKIDRYFSEKQMFMLIEKFKKYEKIAPDRLMVGVTREKLLESV